LKIIYIFTTALINDTYSVQDKVISQINSFNKNGVNCSGAFFTTQITEKFSLNRTIEYLPVKKTNKRVLNKIFQRKQLDRAIYEFIKENYNSIDFFYFRYQGSSKGLVKIVKKFGKKIISEHQSMEMPDIKSNAIFHPFSLKPSLFLSWFLYYWWPIYQYKKWAPKYLKSIFLATVVTSELVDYISQFGCKNVWVLGNGIDLDKYTIHQSLKLENNLNIFVLIGASAISQSHGVDRLIKSVKNNDSKFFIKLNIYSKQSYECSKGDNYQILYLGYKSKDDLDIEMNSFHIAVGAVASFRKNYKYASALKVREYFARGFPVIMSSFDSDLSNDIDAAKYILYVPNNENIISFSKLEPQIMDIFQDELHPQKIKNIADRLISWDTKIKELVLLLQKIN
jgi:hypothetical protein